MAISTPVLYWAQFIALGAGFIILFFVVVPLSLVLCFMGLSALRSHAGEMDIFEKLEGFCHRHGWTRPLAICNRLAKLFCWSTSRERQMAYIKEKQDAEREMQALLRREDFLVAEIETFHTTWRESHPTNAEVGTLQKLEQERDEIPSRLREHRRRFEELTAGSPTGPWIREDARKSHRVLGRWEYQRLADPEAQ